MTPQQTDDEPKRSTMKKMTTVSRRQAMATIAAAGGLTALSLGGSSSEEEISENLNVGGGPMSDAMSGNVARLYEGPSSDLDDPGIQGRFFKITEDDADTGWSAGTLLEDDGEIWKPIDLGVGSLEADSAVIGVEPSEGANGILEAIDELPEDGGVIDLRAGVYEVAPGGLSIPRGKPLKIQDRSAGSAVITIPDGEVDSPDFGIVEVEHGSEKLTLEGFTVDGNRDNVSGTNANSEGIDAPFDGDDESGNVRLENLTVKNISGGDAIDIDGGWSDVRIINCDVEGVDKDGFHMSGANDSAVIGCRAVDCRRGFTNVNGSIGNTISGNVSIDNDENYRLEDPCEWVGNSSVGGTIPDDLRGAKPEGYVGTFTDGDDDTPLDITVNLPPDDWDTPSERYEAYLLKIALDGSGEVKMRIGDSGFVETDNYRYKIEDGTDGFRTESGQSEIELIDHTHSDRPSFLLVHIFAEPIDSDGAGNNMPFSVVHCDYSENRDVLVRGRLDSSVNPIDTVEIFTDTGTMAGHVDAIRDDMVGSLRDLL